MILADTLAEAFRNAAGLEAAASDLRVMLDGTPKFVFEPDTARLARDAITDPAKAAAEIPLPDEICWLEFHLDREKVGFFFYSAGESLRLARCLVVQLPAGSDELTITTEWLDLDAGGLIAQANYNPLLLGALALLGTPALVERRQVNQDRLNRARDKRGKPRLYDHAQLRLVDLDLARPQRHASNGGPGWSDSNRRAHRREHFCRAHLRLKRGRFEFVRPHWRGDPKLGHVEPAYRVRV